MNTPEDHPAFAALSPEARRRVARQAKEARMAQARAVRRAAVAMAARKAERDRRRRQG